MPEHDEPMEMQVRSEDPQEPPSVFWAWVAFAACGIAMLGFALFTLCSRTT